LNILGINCFSHDTSACLLQDGRIVAFAEEERFNREKHTRAFPHRSIQFCLEFGGMGIRDIDYVAYPFKPFTDYWRGFVDFLGKFPHSYKRFAGQTVFDYRLVKKVIEFNKMYGYKKRSIFVGHHEAHAASSFLVSPFEEAAILSIDRGGDYLSTVLGRGKGHRVEILNSVRNPHSLGSLYSVLTSYLGFKPNGGEGKVMGLAPYGSPTFYEDFKELVQIKERNGFEVDLSYFTYHLVGGYGVSEKFLERFGRPREPESSLEERHEDIAWALQKVTEDAACSLAQSLQEQTGLRKLCLAGGVALNSVMNTMILQNTDFEEVFVQPAANDGGTSMGAALYLWHTVLGKRREWQMEDAYLGPAYTDSEIEHALSKYEMDFEKVDNPARVGAKLLADGKIIGWLQGRMEIGPRALGNRSILADPRPPEMKDILNSRVKHREGFRPFAPSVLEEDAAEYFEDSYPSPFMLFVLPIKKKVQDKVPAVCHVDGTGRLQTVSRKANPLYYELVSEFKKITGVPMVLNTSFNIRGEPIVCSPEDALKCFAGTEMDALIMGKCFVRKNTL
jgi:carbamoyltransferase